MKPFAFFCFLFAACFLQGQDTLFKKDNSKEIVNVIGLTAESVKYKRLQNPDGPDYLMYTSELLLIAYHDGHHVLFEAPKGNQLPVAEEHLYYYKGLFYIGDRKLSQNDFNTGLRLGPIKPLASKINVNNSLSRSFGIAGIPFLLAGTVTTGIWGISSALIHGAGEASATNQAFVNDLSVIAGCSLSI
ncbi:MAG: hypothetical protein ACXVPD_12790, partial [Bacteroidia bacterium]